jgi:hypothetical protein
MAKTLIGAVATKSGVNAWYRLTALGSTQDLSANGPWPQAVTEAATALIDACDAETVELDDVVQAQVYTAISDPAGAANAAPGDCVDVTFRPGATPQQLRAGEAAAVPAAIATARDAFKTAVEAAL